MRTRIMRVILLSLLFAIPLFVRAQSTEITPTPTVTVTPLPTQTPVVTPAAQQTIHIGDTVPASFPAGITSATYYFEGSESQYVAIALEMGAYRLRLLDDLGNELARGDFDPVRGMEIPAVRLPKEGLYTIDIERPEGLDTLTLKLKNLDMVDIAYGQVIDGELSADETAKLYRFAGVRLDVIDISLRSTAFDAYVVMLLNAAGERRTSDDNSGGIRDAFLGMQYLFETGDFLIYVSSADGRSSGAFQLRLNRAEFQPLAIGDSVEVKFTADSQVAYFEFEGSLSDVVNLSVQSGGTIDTLLQMVDPEYIPSYQDDDSGAGFDPEIDSWSLSKEGVYRGMIRPYLIGSEGQVMLTNARVALPSLDSGTQELSLTQKHPAARATFQGEAGQQMKLTMTVDPPIKGTPITVMVMQDNTVLASWASSLRPIELVFLVPEDGPVLVEVRDSQMGPGTVHLSLERVMP